jgi:hypothetical protein
MEASVALSSGDRFVNVSQNILQGFNVLLYTSGTFGFAYRRLTRGANDIIRMIEVQARNHSLTHFSRAAFANQYDRTGQGDAANCFTVVRKSSATDRANVTVSFNNALELSFYPAAS